jgi:hypothetical protein
MRLLRMVAGLVLSLAIISVHPVAAQSCPATDNESARSRLEYFHTVEAYSSVRDSLGVQEGAHTRARPITNAAPDASICARLRATVHAQGLLHPPYIYTIYEIDGRYYMVWVIGPLEDTRIRIENGVLRGRTYWAPFSVFDSSGNSIFDDLF